MTEMFDTTMAQASVLGCVLIDDRCAPQMMSAVRDEDFSGTYRSIFRAIRELFHRGKQIDPVTVLHEMGDLADYREIIMQCMEITPTAHALESHCRILREQTRLNQIRSMAMNLASATNLAEARKILEDAAGFAADRDNNRVFTMTQAMSDFMERHTGEVHYLPWPVKELESELEAEPGDFIVVGGRPSTGKTALTIQCAFHWAQNGYKVGYFSLETNKAKVTDRLVSHAARISKSRIRKNELTDDDWTLFARVSSTRIVNAKLELVEAAGMSCTDIQAFTAMRGYDVIIIDYLQLIQEDGRSPVERVSQISIKLHTMAQNKKVTVVALSQLSRMDKQNPRYATMADLRESGQIEQDADMILLLNPKNVKDAVQGQNRVLRVEKNKEGGLSEIELEFEGHFQTFKKAPVTLDEHMGRRGYDAPPPPEPQRWQPTAEDYEYVGGF